MLSEIDANAIIPAKIGVEHGVPAIAKIAPIKSGYKTIFWPLDVGICFTNTGILKSKIPRIFSPIIISNDAIINRKYAGAKDTKTFPVTAQIIPIVAKTSDIPTTKKNIWRQILDGFSLEYPPTYPIIIGSIDKEHGEIDANNPPPKHKSNGNHSIPSPEVCKSCIKLFI